MSEIKTAVITGAARGIGLAAAERFIDEGYRVAMLDNNHSGLASTVQSLQSKPTINDQIIEVPCDVSSAEQVARAVDQIVDASDRIDVLVNNAGIADFMPVLDTSFEVWQQILATNLNGPFLCSQACIPHMLKHGAGAIVNLTSISGLRASTLRTAYGTSKAALAHLTKQLSAELGHLGIRVNSVAPGPIDTAMAKKVHTPEILSLIHISEPTRPY